MFRPHLVTLALAIAAIGATGCGAYYEDVPAFGETDPSMITVQQSPQTQAMRGTVAAIGVPDNNAQVAIDPGQDVNGAEGYADTDPSALTDFKATLDPYGTWSNDPQYGTVWQPDQSVVGNDFAPYVTGGHWGYDNNDYTWMSDYDWGWAPFHYGRWAYMQNGWGWIPGRRYAPAWVSWRTGAPGYGYVGWGPMAPTWGWRNGSAYGYGFGVSTPYTFCETRNLFAPNLNGRTVAGPLVGTVASNTHPYEGGHTPAHPSVGTNNGGRYGSPPPGTLGVAPPPYTHTPGMARAQEFAHPGTASMLGARAPQLAGPNQPVVTGPRYNNMPVQQFHPQPLARPYGGAPYRSYGGNPAPYRSYGSSAPYRSYGGSTAPMYRGGGGYGGGGMYHAPTTTYSHSYSHSHGGGGGHGGGHR